MSGLDRRLRFAPALIVRGSAAALSSAREKANPTLGVVPEFKTATCGCCSKWIEHLEGAGFRVEATHVAHLASLKSDEGAPQDLQSCHAALVDGYVIEGQVPATDIRRLPLRAACCHGTCRSRHADWITRIGAFRRLSPCVLRRDVIRRDGCSGIRFPPRTVELISSIVWTAFPGDDQPVRLQRMTVEIDPQGGR